MARPSKPLIAKDKTLKVALKIVDSEGLSALSVRRLGKELNINGYSLYHHFKNKDGIVIALCEYVLEQIEETEPQDQAWQEWVLQSQLRAYEVLSQHPNIVPALLRYNLLGISKSATEQRARFLADQGLPAAAILALIEGQVILTAGFLSLEPMEENFNRDASLEFEAPFVYELGTRAGFLPRPKLLELATRSLIEGIEKEYSLA